MNKLLATVLLVALPLSVSGQVSPAAKRAQALRELELVRAASRPGAVRPHAVLDADAENWIFVGAAGSLAGNFGTFYKSDVTIVNHRDVPQVVRARWIPAGQDGFSTEEVFLTIPANSFVAYDDFVGQTMGYSGLGSLEFVARDAEDFIDLNARIDVFSRIWTPQPRTTLGTVSQNFAGVGLFYGIGNLPAVAPGLRQNPQFRTNVGIVNLDLFNDHVFKVTVSGTKGSTTFNMTIPSFSMLQQNIPSGEWGDLIVTFEPADPADTLDLWFAYATTSDNGTGDGWVSIASQITPLE